MQAVAKRACTSATGFPRGNKVGNVFKIRLRLRAFFVGCPYRPEPVARGPKAFTDNMLQKVICFLTEIVGKRVAFGDLPPGVYVSSAKEWSCLCPRILAQALPNGPLIHHLPAPERSFDETWLLSLFAAIARDDRASAAFLLRAPAASHAPPGGLADLRAGALHGRIRQVKRSRLESF
ncbi:MAG: hypothetical protein EA339_04365 [Rhodobacteraceae bacterium]|nr:MAG: hypothetical protein EA339_04365 [Paracoccaceae bacterium]